MKELTDEQIMRKVADGDLDLLTVLFEKHHMHVYRFLLKMSGNQNLSEDLTQDVFFKVIRYRASYNDGKFISWLFTIARNSLSTHFSRNKMSFLEIDESNNDLFLEDESQKPDYAHMYYALDKLSYEDRELLVLSRLQGMGYQEVAEILGSTTGAVKTRACRALQKLRQFYFENL